MTNDLINNFLHPYILFFILGVIAILIKSDLEVPAPVAKFLSLYLLFHIGIKGGEELFHSGFSPEIVKILGLCGLISFATPFLCYQFLRFKLNIYDAGAIAAAYGSISAVNFIAGTAFLDEHHIAYNGYMVASMALMESPAVIAGLIIIGLALKKSPEGSNKDHKTSIGHVIHEALFNGSVFLLVGSLIIGYVSGANGELELKPFVTDIFKGMLCFYMLDMGILAGQKIKSLKGNVLFLGSFALLYPLISATAAIYLARLIGLGHGNALLFTVLVSSASFIAVPAAMRMAVPKANMSLLLPMALGITFVFNIIFGIPIYMTAINYVWGPAAPIVAAALPAVS